MKNLKKKKKKNLPVSVNICLNPSKCLHIIFYCVVTIKFYGNIKSSIINLKCKSVFHLLHFCLFFHWNFKPAFDYQSKPENYCKGHKTWKGKDLELSDSKWSFCFMGAKIYLCVEQNSELHGRAGVQSWCHRPGCGPVGVIKHRSWGEAGLSELFNLAS